MIMSVTRADVVAASRRLAGHVRRTPLIEAHALSATTGRTVWLKLETLQHTRSFKFRGALNAVLAVSERMGALPTLVTASAGNHGLALATAASAAGASLIVYAPRTTPAAKLERMRRPGVRVDTSSRDYDEAERRALEAAAHGDGTYVSPYNNPDVIAGAGTVALEILDDLPSPGGIVVPTGGGGLLSGMALAVRDVAQVVGVEPEVNPAFTSSLAAGRIMAIAPGESLADGLLGNLEAGSITFDLVREHATDVRTVPERCVVQGVRALFRQERLVAEGAGAIAVGALLGGVVDDVPDPLVLVVSGANIDMTTLLEAIAA
jgi:threonine dehydratase